MVGLKFAWCGVTSCHRWIFIGAVRGRSLYCGIRARRPLAAVPNTTVLHFILNRARFLRRIRDRVLFFGLSRKLVLVLVLGTYFLTPSKINFLRSSRKQILILINTSSVDLPRNFVAILRL